VEVGLEVLSFHRVCKVINNLNKRLEGMVGPVWLRALEELLLQNPCINIQTTMTVEIVTDGRDGKQAVENLERGGYQVEEEVKELIRGGVFSATVGKTYKLAVVYSEEGATNQNIRAKAAARGYLTPPMELASYLRELFTNADLMLMGVWDLVLMHEPVAHSSGCPVMLGVNRHGGDRTLGTYLGRPGGKCDDEVACLFLVPSDE
jgi:hypothetical protein